MTRIIWSPRAQHHLIEIADYIARDSPARAEAMIDRIRAATDRLADFPRSGRIIPEIERENSREVLCPPYRIMYEVRSDYVVVVAVIHGARDWKPDKPTH